MTMTLAFVVLLGAVQVELPSDIGRLLGLPGQADVKTTVLPVGVG